MPPKLDSLIASMTNTQAGFLRAADAVPAKEWRTRPSEGRWSAAELVAHLMMVERAVIGKADRVAQKPPKHVPLFKRIHLPMALVESRLIRRKSPVPIDTAMLQGKEVMLAELRDDITVDGLGCLGEPPAKLVVRQVSEHQTPDTGPVGDLFGDREVDGVAVARCLTMAATSPSAWQTWRSDVRWVAAIKDSMTGSLSRTRPTRSSASRPSQARVNPRS